MPHTNDVKIKALSSFIAENATQSCKPFPELPILMNGVLKHKTQAAIDACRELEANLTEPYK
jgi:hypothetical protein